MRHKGPHLPDLSRRRLIAGAAAVAGAAMLPFPAFAATAEAAGLIRAIPKSRWDWTIEQMALARINTDRPAALHLLWAAFAIDLDPRSTWRRKRALRLYDLFAAAATPADRLALAALILRSPQSGPLLRARAALWSDPVRRARRGLWRSTGPAGEPLGIAIAAA